MSDLMDRLRSEAANWSATCGDLFDEAADEIERLRGRDEMHQRANSRIVRENNELRGLLREAMRSSQWDMPSELADRIDAALESKP